MENLNIEESNFELSDRISEKPLTGKISKAAQNLLLEARKIALGFGALLAFAPFATAGNIDLPEKFDHMGPTVQTLKLSNGRTVAYVDTGPSSGSPVLFVGGTGTSAAVVGLTDFLRGMREDLGLRLISVGRAGFGQSEAAENWTYDDFASDAEEVLKSLNVGGVKVMAISGGGPYSAAFAARNPDRVQSIHLAAATALVDESPLCGLDDATLGGIINDFAAHPLKWWAFPADSPTHIIPGFGTAAADDGARTFSVAGQKGDGAAEVAEIRRYCEKKLPDVSGVKAPVFIYQGLKDTQVSPANAKQWATVYPNVARTREYPEGGHDVQYRHWDQILIDMAGMHEKTVICQDGNSTLVAEAEAEASLASGATLGVCAWNN